MQNQITKSNKKYYSVKEINEMIGVPISTLHDTISRLFPEKKKNGKKTLLDKIEVGLISKELKKSNKIDLTDIRKVAITEYEETEIIANAFSILNRKLKELQPKADAYDKFINSENHITIGEFSKTINIGRNKCFEILRDRGIIDRNNIPYQNYMKYFIVRQIEKNGKLYPTTFINAKGIDYLTKIITKKEIS